VSQAIREPHSRRLDRAETISAKNRMRYRHVWGTAPRQETLHLTPYTLHLTPYTLHLTPYTLHLTPYTLHLTPYTLFVKKIEGGTDTHVDTVAEEPRGRRRPCPRSRASRRAWSGPSRSRSSPRRRRARRSRRRAPMRRCAGGGLDSSSSTSTLQITRDLKESGFLCSA
jgi:hypothetical protein